MILLLFKYIWDRYIKFNRYINILIQSIILILEKISGIVKRKINLETQIFKLLLNKEYIAKTLIHSIIFLQFLKGVLWY